MFAQLGNDLKFNLITSFNGLSENNSYNFVEHSRINQKPILQYLGENLQTFSIKMNFNLQFCNPTKTLVLLKNLAKQGTPLKYIKGNGEYVGIFAITDISSTTEQTDSNGNLIGVQADISLKEYTGKVKDETESSGGFKVK